MIRTRNLHHYTLLMGTKAIMLAGFISCGVMVSPLSGQAPAQPTTQVASGAPASVPNTYVPNNFPKRERSYYELFWGVDSLAAKAVESGELIKFSYRVLDADKAKTLNDKNNEPAMYAPASRAKLVIPSLEKVGQLRQSSTPEAGR